MYIVQYSVYISGYIGLFSAPWPHASFQRTSHHRPAITNKITTTTKNEAGQNGVIYATSDVVYIYAQKLFYNTKKKEKITFRKPTKILWKMLAEV